jgi:hypothetical protein
MNSNRGVVGVNARAAQDVAFSAAKIELSVAKQPPTQSASVEVRSGAPARLGKSYANLRKRSTTWSSPNGR